ncbi:2-oxoacid:ferredoxin oxidoreductase subunit beta [Hyphobacterium indicum]|uniref:2-oxoacid:ferredoxin oxidoreductase subunit beta n=1 Tax=Hyphobacterium indicum TaxID=2162714 RepID=UPI000D65A604|nr:2-oxoacid:ferredoxin oxidoreductase subunit beta [Hyphobacterium indicum]
MTSIKKPLVDKHLRKNRHGLTQRDYEGVASTLCAGCGHDSITAAFVRAFHELDLEPHRAAKVSGIGCSSKTTAYFLGQSSGINTVHGRMPSVATGAAAVNPDLHYIGVSGDGDSLSIGLGQFAHAIRRNLNMLYVIENNGVYGLTKGQFSASADIGTRAKYGEVNEQTPIDPVRLALTLGATFVARSFSGDKEQLVPLIKAGLMHRGFAVIDVVSPCVTFNDHAGSTKSYAHTYKYYHPVIHADFVPEEKEITADYADGEAITIPMHNGGDVILRKTDTSHDPRDRDAAFDLLKNLEGSEIPTGLIYIDESRPEMGEMNHLPDTPLNAINHSKLCPGSATLKQLMDGYA